MPLYRIYNRKNPKYLVPKNGYRSMQIIGYKSHKSRDSVTVDSKLDYQSTTSRPSVFSWSPHAHLSTSCWLTSSTCCRCLYHVELPRPLTSTLPGRLTLTFDLLSIYLDPRPIVDPPRLRPSVDPPRLEFHCKEYNNPTFSHLLSSLLKPGDS
jgi:hypothetical protein